MFSGNRQSHTLFSEKDLESTLDRIEVVHFHQEVETSGIRFTCYHAGHVLDCWHKSMCVFYSILYTGDFSRQTDRHLVSAEIPNVKPDVLIMESTYGIYIHEKREVREARFTNAVRDIVMRGGRCLIPAFALGRAQEQLLILDEFWEQNKRLLGHIPVFYASTLAKKCLAVYQTYSSAMNQQMQEQMKIMNPFKFKHISFVKGMDEFNDNGPCVILASPGMLQDGFSRDLFELWCSDSKNGVIIAGYSVDGTLAKVMSINGRPLSRKCSIDYISFSAHADYNEFKELVEGVSPTNIVFCQLSEMFRLKNSLLRDLSEKNINNINIYTPRNTHSLDLFFKGELFAKVYGKLVPGQSDPKHSIGGVIMKSGFSYKIFSPDELQVYTELKSTNLKQKLKIPFPNDIHLYEALIQNLSILAGQDIKHETADFNKIKFDNVDLIRTENSLVMTWVSDVKNDAVADTLVAIICETTRTKKIIHPYESYESTKKKSLIELLKHNYGQHNVTEDDSCIQIIVGGCSKAMIDKQTYSVTSEIPETKKLLEREVFHYKNAIDTFCNCKCH
ncbi:Cleavage and polyadenylation specificity factor subunit 3 [Thelohanellus kitauei]|uniref:Cleavage and polyadenylation specificity factor subunit 3 n=1 Tax=Thelohanellus kitauei TaxID=669202 RepID=A0A0C2JE24_THEKT|nr:Cleavage and polyadenylation specificity factor subunit 3 [Thelohanellus kitauei]